jgi:hypothetical protein
MQNNQSQFKVKSYLQYLLLSHTFALWVSKIDHLEKLISESAIVFSLRVTFALPFLLFYLLDTINTCDLPDPPINSPLSANKCGHACYLIAASCRFCPGPKLTITEQASSVDTGKSSHARNINTHTHTLGTILCARYQFFNSITIGGQRWRRSRNFIVSQVKEHANYYIYSALWSEG